MTDEKNTKKTAQKAASSVTKPAQKAGKTRDDRLKSALKANMAKRKTQARARNASDEQ